MFFYNQLDYDNVDYSKPNGQSATVKSSGCGVCSTLMVLNNLFGKELMTVKQMAKFSIDHGARNNYGTDVNALLKALSKKYNINYKPTYLNKELWDHLKKGGMAVVNQDDTHDVFSDSGHFVVAYKAIGNDTVICLDPYWYEGKFNRNNRMSHITKIVGKEIYLPLKEVGWCSKDRNPCYYLVSKKVIKPTPPSVKVGQILKLKKGARVYAENNSKKVLKISDFSQFNVSAEALLKVGAKVQVASVVKNSNGNIWVYVSKYKGWICIWDGKVSKV